METGDDNRCDTVRKANGTCWRLFEYDYTMRENWHDEFQSIDNDSAALVV